MAKSCDYKVDLYGLGIISFLMLSGTLPYILEIIIRYNTKNQHDIMKQTITQKVIFNKGTWNNVSLEAQEFVKSKPLFITSNFNSFKIYYKKIPTIE